MATKRRVKKVAKRKRTTKDTPLTKLDFWAIAANEIYVACRKAGMSEANSLAFAMDRSSYPDWIVDVDDPVRKPWDDDEESD
jgi:hypothetical protein